MEAILKYVFQTSNFSTLSRTIKHYSLWRLFWATSRFLRIIGEWSSTISETKV